MPPIAGFLPQRRIDLAGTHTCPIQIDAKLEERAIAVSRWRVPPPLNRLRLTLGSIGLGLHSAFLGDQLAHPLQLGHLVGGIGCRTVWTSSGSGSGR